MRPISWSIIAGILVPLALHACAGLGSVMSCIVALAMAACFRGNSKTCYWYTVATFASCLRIAIIQEPLLPPLPPLFESARVSFATHIEHLLPEPHAAFLTGLLTGERGNIPLPVLEDMRRTGLTHILAVSGTNITLVLVLLDRALWMVHRRWKVFPLAAGIVTFTLFCGAGASVVRACIMGLLQVFALQTGRIAETRLLIGWTAAAMLFVAPSQIADDAGFQLSFLATVGLCEFHAPISRLLRRVPSALGLRDGLVTTCSAQLTTGPWAAYLFGTLPLHAPLLNVLVTPLIPVAMTAGIAGTAMGTVHATLGSIGMLPTWLALSIVLHVARIGAEHDFLILENMQGNSLLLVLWLCALGFLWTAARRYERKSATLETHAPA